MSVLLSMTGYGEAAIQAEQASCRVEIRTVNNRHFKLSLRCPEGFQPYEPDFEKLLRETISRGTVYLSVRIEQSPALLGPRLNAEMLKTYWHQLNDICRELNVSPPDVTRLLELPGVMNEQFHDAELIEKTWPVIEKAVADAARHLQEFRQQEGLATANEMRRLLSSIDEILANVVTMAPQVSRDYHDKLLQRTRELLAGSDVRIEPSDIIKEVAFYADRCDIHEEITRLKSHLHQFLTLLEKAASPGRKLDFLCQEMFREVNTIGSKANHIGLSHAAVDMKSNIERIREIVQNVE